METTLTVEEKQVTSKSTSLRKKIPKELVYEVIDGKSYYYKGYKEVLNNGKKIEDIMGSSGLQSLIIDNILMYLYDNLPRNEYKILTNELGVHLDVRNNLAADISIYQKAKLTASDINEKYIKVAPKIIMEIDTHVDLNDFDKTMDYLNLKTNKLIDFGVEKVFWFLTKSRLIFESMPVNEWRVTKWSNEINVVDNYKFSLEKLLKDDGIIK